MKLKDTAFGQWVASQFETDVAGDMPAPQGNPAPATQPPATTQAPATVSAKVRELISAQAETYCELLVAKGKALPNQLAAIKEDFIQAAVDDEAMPLGEGKSRLATFKSRYEGTAEHALLQEKVADKATHLRVLTSTPADAEEAELAKLEEQEREAQRRQKKTA